MRAEEYLEEIKKLDAVIANKIEVYERLTGMAMGLGGDASGERVKASRNLKQIPNAIAGYIDLEREIKELERKREAIINTIERLPYPEYKVIYMLYVNDHTYKEVAYAFGMSCEWVKKRRKNALRLVQNILDKE